MRWRLAPSLQLEKVSATKCLLLGAGTLGCYVARCLLVRVPDGSRDPGRMAPMQGWGIRRITFVDSARVSFSNPGGKPKAQCAADNLKKIFPGVVSAISHPGRLYYFPKTGCVSVQVTVSLAVSEGHMILIPMPGHAVPPAMAAEVRQAVRNLENLFLEHDVVFLLMDSRESRWLPTVIGASQGKLFRRAVLRGKARDKRAGVPFPKVSDDPGPPQIVINAALGFDTYLVMRHGARQRPARAAEVPTAASGAPPADLGCYFCNDIVAPTDVVHRNAARPFRHRGRVQRGAHDHTSAPRPWVRRSLKNHAGNSPYAANVLCGRAHLLIKEASPFRLHAPADMASVDSASSTPLGLVPHQIRGFLSQFSNLLMVGKSYDRCPACSDKV
ncbi:MAG: hypothetical protein BJ554DRAFT_1813 [Olpidium bornovanus]|uniref:THIF-type NAD/FAD binding fold domain-containing protein n=1 Tax=Olpidium bornovanus TaxID=278681 RepID=A0A8H7ZRT4_9FUNG|nr:MAG: hypothetical protein BJ554DRAFT_1813 [Olpidium bornovanus]